LAQVCGKKEVYKNGEIDLNLKQAKERLGVLIRINLRHNDLRQLDLAKHLNISTSAVSQIITGRVGPSLVHYKKIIEYLKCSNDDIVEMDDLFIQVRSGMTKVNSTGEKSVKLPIVCIDNLFKFCPAIEDLRTYISRNCKQEALLKDADDPIDYENVFKVFAAGNRFNPQFPGLLTLLVDIEAFPVTTDIILAKSYNNEKLVLKKFVLEDNNIHLLPFNGVVDKQETKVDNLEWMRKVLKITVSDL